MNTALALCCKLDTKGNPDVGHPVFDIILFFTPLVKILEVSNNKNTAVCLPGYQQQLSKLLWNLKLLPPTDNYDETQLQC